jgi:predicted metalloprotease
MFKLIVVVLLFVIGATLYEQNQISLLSEEQKQTILLEQIAEKKKQIRAKEEQSQKMEELSNTPWAEVEPAQYVEKFFADQNSLWLLLFLAPISAILTYKIYYRNLKSTQT